jgi:hypothetical protein
MMRRTLLALLLATSSLGAQDSTCSYDRCAIWERDGRLFAGWPGRKLRGGDGPTRIGMTSDSARFYATRYRRNYDVGMPLSYAGLAGFAGYLFYTQAKLGDYGAFPRTSTQKLWYFGSVSAVTVATPFLHAMQGSGVRMAWWYNRELDRPAALQDSSCSYDRCALWLKGRNIMRGMPGTKLRHARDELPAMLEGKQGVEYALRYRKRLLRSNTLFWVGGGLVAGSLISLGVRGGGDPNLGDPIVEVIGFVGGLLATEAGLFTMFSAQKEAQRAAWWYNRTLPP